MTVNYTPQINKLKLYRQKEKNKGRKEFFFRKDGQEGFWMEVTFRGILEEEKALGVGEEGEETAFLRFGG